MKKVLSVMVAGMLLVLFVGCGLVTVKKDVDFNREGLKIGMTKIEFYKVYPESVFKETRMTLDGTKIEALEVADEYYSLTPVPGQDPKTGMVKKAKWYYFCNDRLIQSGEPNEWPK